MYLTLLVARCVDRFWCAE
uniref:Uncharacterized protein n=1 Tax=Arundo donax TaxID=35708 RepID=A0A0A8YS48_ARUDO